MEDKKKNTLRLEYLPLQEALELYSKGIFVKGVIPGSSYSDLSDEYKSIYEEFEKYYVQDIATNVFEYDLSMDDYQYEMSGEYNITDVELEGMSHEIENIYEDELGYNLRSTDGSIINYDNNRLYNNQEEYLRAKKEILSKAKKVGIETLKTIGGTLLAPITRYHTMKASKVKDIDKILEGGLYHFTSDKAADKIIESGYIKPSSRTTSYSFNKKSFFFAGEEQGSNGEKGISLDNAIYNLGDLHSNMTAIHVKYNEALKRDVKSGKVQVRLDDGAICIVGKASKEYGYELEKVNMQFVVDKETNRAYYKEVEEKDMTKQDIETSIEYEELFNRYNKMPKFARDLITYPIMAKKMVSKYFESRKSLKLPDTKQNNYILNDNNSQMFDYLDKNKYDDYQANKNFVEFEEKQNNNKNIEYERSNI